jgi:geranyl-CoA carboxylase alpha subunit
MKVLIANRSEIALRIICTAKKMGLHTVAVYSDADAGTPHTQAADEAWALGGSAPKDCYLNIAKLIDIAKRSGATAVHPGYGFLAENAAFAQACCDAGLIFIGPSPLAITQMGDKAQAKQLMKAAGVPCIEGYEGSDQTSATLATKAALIGYPIMIKAAAGGGGRGMRLVNAAAEFSALLANAQSEALNAFGDSTVLLEKAVTNPRHIEIQIVADRFGNVIHLGERECSIQRRHQKIIEEAPSPAVSQALRAAMGAVAVRATKAIQYEGVGTYEFLLDEAGNFYFMEMNTRLQVEHPVTEAITGLDLVAMQIDIARGLPLSIKQEQVQFNGHAIEVRLCAEDVSANFMPQSGLLLNWHAPSQVRVEHSLTSGAAISPYYDSMIAKIISHGENRRAACDQLGQGLTELVALGIQTNQDFLGACITHPAFQSGEFNTGFIEAYFPELNNLTALTNQPSLSSGIPPLAVAAALLISSRKNNDVAPKASKLKRLLHSFPINLKFSMSETMEATVVQTSDGLDIRTADFKSIVALNFIGPTTAIVNDASQHHTLNFAVSGATVYFRYKNANFRVTDESYTAKTSVTHEASDGHCRATINGKLIKLHVNVGDTVTVGQALFTIEAMKMEHVHSSKRNGIVQVVSVSEGDQIRQKQSVLALIIPD